MFFFPRQDGKNQLNGVNERINDQCRQQNKPQFIKTVSKLASVIEFIDIINSMLPYKQTNK